MQFNNTLKIKATLFKEKLVNQLELITKKSHNNLSEINDLQASKEFNRSEEKTAKKDKLDVDKELAKDILLNIDKEIVLNIDKEKFIHKDDELLESLKS